MFKARLKLFVCLFASTLSDFFSQQITRYRLFRRTTLTRRLKKYAATAAASQQRGDTGNRDYTSLVCTYQNYLERDNLLPREDVEVFVAAEVTVRGGGLVTLVATTLEVERLAHHTRAEVERRLDLGENFRIRNLTSAVGVDVHGKRLGDANGVGDLEQAAAGEASRDDRLGRLAGNVRARAVNLGRVLTGEGTTTVGTPTAVSVDNNLTTSQTGVTVRATDNEAARRVQVEDGVGVEVLFRDNLLDDFVHQVFGNLLVGDGFVVLSGDQDGVHTLRDHGTAFVFVLNGDLGLTIRAHPRAGAILTDDGEAVAELGRQHVGERHQRLGLIRSVAEHVTLVTGTNLFIRLGTHTVNALANVRGLLVEADEHLALVTIQTDVIRDETNVTADLSHDGFVINLRLGGDFTENHNHVGLRRRFARNLGIRVLFEARVEDTVGNLIRELIRVSFVDGFRGEKESHLYCFSNFVFSARVTNNVD